MLALRTIATLCSALFLIALVPTETTAIQLDSDLTTTVVVDADGQYAGTPGVELVVPEPASVALLGLGLLGLAIICRRRVAAPAKSRWSLPWRRSHFAFTGKRS